MDNRRASLLRCWAGHWAAKDDQAGFDRTARRDGGRGVVQRSSIRRGLPQLAAAVGEWIAYCAPTMEAPPADDAELLDEVADVAPPQALAARLPDVTTPLLRRSAPPARPVTRPELHGRGSVPTGCQGLPGNRRPPLLSGGRGRGDDSSTDSGLTCSGWPPKGRVASTNPWRALTNGPTDRFAIRGQAACDGRPSLGALGASSCASGSRGKGTSSWSKVVRTSGATGRLPT